MLVARFTRREGFICRSSRVRLLALSLLVNIVSRHWKEFVFYIVVFACQKLPLIITLEVNHETCYQTGHDTNTNTGFACRAEDTVTCLAHYQNDAAFITVVTSATAAIPRTTFTNVMIPIPRTIPHNGLVFITNFTNGRNKGIHGGVFFVSLLVATGKGVAGFVAALVCCGLDSKLKKGSFSWACKSGCGLVVFLSMMINVERKRITHN